MSGGPVELVAFDMEGCLTTDPTVWELMHRRLGTWESHGLPYLERFRAGELDYDEFARLDVAAWRGAPAGLLEECAARVPLREGCAELLRALRRAGVALAVITNGLRCAAERFRALGVEHVFANRALADGAVLSGRLELEVPYGGKGRVLRRLAARLGVARERVAAVGDGPADVAMFAEAGVSVAVCPRDPEVVRAARHVLAGDSLAPLRALLLGGAAQSPDGPDSASRSAESYF